MPEWFSYVAPALMAGFLTWIFWSDAMRKKRDVVPLAEAMSIAELRIELRKIADNGGSLQFEEGACPLPEAAVYRAKKEGLVKYGHRTDAPSDTTELLWLTDRGWRSIGKEPPKGFARTPGDIKAMTDTSWKNQLLGSMWFAIPLLALMVTAISVCAPFFMLHALVREKRRS